MRSFLPIGNVTKVGEGKVLKLEDIVPFYVRVVNAITAECIINTKSDDKFIENLHPNQVCWQNKNVVKKFKKIFQGYNLNDFFSNEYMDEHYQKDIAICMRRNAPTGVLGPPLNPNFQFQKEILGDGRWKLISQDVNDLKVIGGKPVPKKK